MAPQAARRSELRDRSVEMLKKDLILKNPLRTWEPDTGSFGSQQAAFYLNASIFEVPI